MELLVLQTLQWEVSTVTSMDFLDHILTRLSESSNNQHQGIINIDKVNFSKQIEELKIKMEQVLVLAVTDYFFSYLNPSLLAASAAHLVLSRLTNETKITEDLCQYIGAITVRFLFVCFIFIFIIHIYRIFFVFTEWRPRLCFSIGKNRSKLPITLFANELNWGRKSNCFGQEIELPSDFRLRFFNFIQYWNECLNQCTAST